jgi:hypothetical protein
MCFVDLGRHKIYFIVQNYLIGFYNGVGNRLLHCRNLLKIIKNNLPFSNINYILSICAVIQRIIGHDLYSLTISKQVDLLNIN